MFHISGTRRKEEALVGDSLGGGNSQGDSSGGSVANNRDDKGGAQDSHNLRMESLPHCPALSCYKTLGSLS